MMRPLRSIVLLLTLSAAAACGGATDAPAPTGITPSGPDDAASHSAGSISIVSGDNQTVGVGSAVGTAPIVRVMSERGRLLRGASLSLSTESGRGTLDAAAVVTNDAGEATLPRWVAPLTAGDFAVSISAAGQSGAAVTARVVARVADTPQTAVTQSIGTAGGIVSVASTGSPINGLTIKVPPAAFPGTNTFVVSTQPPPAVPVGLTIAGPAIVIGGPTTVSDSVVTVRVPASVTTGVGKLRVMVMTVENTLIPIPSVTSDANSVTVRVRTFGAPSDGAASLSLPGANVSTNRSAVSLLTLILVRWQPPTGGVYTTNFLVGRDNPGFVNRSAFWEGGEGFCAGTSVFSGGWFRRGGAQLTMRAQFPPLLTAAETNNWDLADQLNPAIRAASALALRYMWNDNTLGWVKARFVETPATLWDNVLMQIATRRQPVYLAIEDANQKTGHAILAYSIDVIQERIYVVDPNFPETVRYVQYHSATQSLDPYPSSPISGDPKVDYTYFSDATYLFLEDAPRIAGIINKYMADGYRTEFPPVAGRVKLANSVVAVNENITSFNVDAQEAELRFVATDLSPGMIEHVTVRPTGVNSGSFLVFADNDTLRIPLSPGLNKIGLVFRKIMPSGKETWYDAKLINVTKTEQLWNLAPTTGSLSTSFSNNIASGTGTLTLNFPPTVRSGDPYQVSATLTMNMTFLPNIRVDNEGIYVAISGLNNFTAYKQVLFGAGPPGRSISTSVTANAVWTVPATGPGSASGIGRLDFQITAGFLAGSGVSQFGFNQLVRYNQVP